MGNGMTRGKRIGFWVNISFGFRKRVREHFVLVSTSALVALTGCATASYEVDPSSGDTETTSLVDSQSEMVSDTDTVTESGEDSALDSDTEVGTSSNGDSETASQDETEVVKETDSLFDECTSGTHNCSEFATCVDIDEGFDCHCNKGYVGKGVTCLPAGLTGDLTQASPGYFQDGDYAQSCAKYRNPDEPYLYSGSTGTGFYFIDPEGDGVPKIVFCDMNSGGGGWTLIAQVRRQTGMPIPGCEDAGSDPEALGYSIDATGIAFGEIAVTHNGLATAAFASFVLDAKTIFSCQGTDVVFLQKNGRYSILFLGEASSGGWGDIPLACFNAVNRDCLFESRTDTYGVVATGKGNCQQLNDGTGESSTCGAWGLAPNEGNTTWESHGGRIFIR